MNIIDTLHKLPSLDEKFQYLNKIRELVYQNKLSISSEDKIEISDEIKSIIDAVSSNMKSQWHTLNIYFKNGV